MTATEAPPSATQAFEAGYEQYKQFGEQVLDTARKAAVQSIDTYQKAVDRAIDVERKVAGVTKQEWLKGLIDSHADVTHELTAAYTSAVRGLLA